MDSQFYRIQTYGLFSSGKKANISRIIAEGLRVPHGCKHVAFPCIPTILYGKDLHGTTAMLRKLKKEHEKTHRKLLPNAQLLGAAVASYPLTTEQLENNPLEVQDYLSWRELVIDFAKAEYGDQLHGIIEHLDEAHPHIHIWVKPKEIDGVLRLGPIHPGQWAERLKEPLERKPAYKQAMRALQDRYWWAVGKIMGWLRISEKPQPRLSNRKWKAKKKREQKEMQDVKDIQSIQQNSRFSNRMRPSA